MLKIFNPKIINKFQQKYATITITNVCNLSCGGCHQLCGLFDKKKLWFVGLEQIKKLIYLVKKYNKNIKNKEIGIFGGEPTLHPEWDQILLMLYDFEDCTFIVYTNGRVNVEKKYGAVYKDKQIFISKNVKFNVSPKCGDNQDHENIEHLPQLMAPIDYEPNKNKQYFWKKAQTQCVMWNCCGKTIYNNKSYFCESAAAMDQLEGGHRGWEIKEGEDPFNKTEFEISKQAKEFCYRCGNFWSGNWWDVSGMNLPKGLPKGMKIQHIEDPYFVSETNLKLIDGKKINKIKLHVINDVNYKN